MTASVPTAREIVLDLAPLATPLDDGGGPATLSVGKGALQMLSTQGPATILGCRPDSGPLGSSWLLVLVLDGFVLLGAAALPYRNQVRAARSRPAVGGSLTVEELLARGQRR